MSGGPRELVLAGPLIDAALAEDVGRGDATTNAVVSPSAMGEGTILSRATGVICGLPMAAAVFRRVDPALRVETDAVDGDRVVPNQVVMRVRGGLRGILTAERTALNFLQHLSGIATATAEVVAALDGTGLRVLDTRKTLPGMRVLAKYAVRCGGGVNHRRGLDDMILIKENHIEAAGGIPQAIRRARTAHPDLKLEIEVRNDEELRLAAAAGPDRIMLDNYTPPAAREAAVWLRAQHPAVEIELSGGINRGNLRDYAGVAADFVSMGAITHSVPALDLSLVVRSPAVRSVVRAEGEPQ